MNNKVLYYHRRNDTNTIFYFGLGEPSRPTSKEGRSRHWHSIVKKHGYTIEIVATNLSQEFAALAETEAINAYRRRHPGKLVNISDGGEVGFNVSPEKHHNFKGHVLVFNNDKDCFIITGKKAVVVAGFNKRTFGDFRTGRSKSITSANLHRNGQRIVFDKFQIIPHLDKCHKFITDNNLIIAELHEETVLPPKRINKSAECKAGDLSPFFRGYYVISNKQFCMTFSSISDAVLKGFTGLDSQVRRGNILTTSKFVHVQGMCVLFTNFNFFPVDGDLQTCRERVLTFKEENSLVEIQQSQEEGLRYNFMNLCAVGLYIGTHVDTNEIIAADGPSMLASLSFNTKAITDCLKGKARTHKNFIWSRTDDIEILADMLQNNKFYIPESKQLIQHYLLHRSMV